MLAITKYADRLDKDLDDVDYLERIKIGQRNWIGKSEGSELEFRVVTDKIFSSGPRMREEEMPDQLGKDIIDSNSYVKIFTTRADTLFGATYVVLAPEHELVEKLKNQMSNWSDIKKYIEKIKNETDIDRTALDKEKTGVELKGVKAINPATEEEIPIWIADYVLASYGTGAVMAVPAHDERDFEFAKKYDLPIVQVVSGGEINDKAYTDDGILINSGKFNKMTSGEARKKITEAVGGKMVTKFKLRDWIFSRQRYWGEPIPIIHCEKCGYVPVPEKDLPLVLPKVKSYTPTDNGESPLATITKWVNVKCPKCKGKAQRETDTMPNWAGSSWYYLRYIDPKNKKEFASQKNLKYWLGTCPVRDREGSQRVPISNGVDWYNGGMEHTTLHLLYSRFWHKFLYDLKLVPTKEPYKKRTAHGMILAEDGEKMSKSRGNVINPDEIIKLYGADTLRIYEMFIGPFDQTVVWNTNSIIGSRRFIEKVWRLGQRVASPDTFVQVLGSPSPSARPDHSQKYTGSATFQTLLHKTIKKVTEDVESMSFNTAISSMMILANEIETILNKGGEIKKDDFKKFLQILSPFAPHMADELWATLGEKKSISLSGWPKWDKKKIIEEEVKIAVQVNGKVRAEIMVSKDMTEEEVKSLSLKEENIMAWVKGKEIKKFIYIPGRIINFVVI
jgi:leucyl-tRNA synthetase